MITEYFNDVYIFKYNTFKILKVYPWGVMANFGENVPFWGSC